MLTNIKEKITNWKQSKKFLVKLEEFLSTWQYLAALAAFIFVTQALGLDLLGFAVIGVLFCFICVCGKNTNAAVPILCMAVFCVSIQHSPSQNASGYTIIGKCVYYLKEVSSYYSSLWVLIPAAVLGVMVLASIAYRLIAYGDFKRAFTKKGLLWGIILLGISFITSGMFSKSYAFVDFFFGAQLAATFIVVYLFFVSTLDFDTFDFNYIANIMIAILVYMIALLAYIYATRFYGFLILSIGWKTFINAGWGISLDIGSYIAMTIPACFYKISKTRIRYKWIWVLLTIVGIIAIYFTLARGAMVSVAVLLLLSLIIVVRNQNLSKKIFLVLLGTIAVVGILLGILAVTDNIQYFFDYFLQDREDVSSGRFTIWYRYMQYFKDSPIFGSGFAADLEAGFAKKDPANGIFNIYSFLAHNLFFQMMGSCGVVGVLALFAHVFSTFRVMLKEFDMDRGFLVLAILGYLLLSMLDVIFFKPQFIFLYLALLVACEADLARKIKQIEESQHIPSPNTDDPSYKPRVVFSYVEAGMGHITPVQALSDAFEEKYGKYCTVVRSRFFNETGNEALIKLERNFVKEVKKYNHSWLYGYFNMFLMNVFGTKLLPKMIMEMYVPGAKLAAMQHMRELAPDMVVNTHWATTYYAELVREKPLNVTYVPDVQMITLFRLPCDMVLMSAQRGYENALKTYKKRFNEENSRLVACAIRKEAFTYSMDKKANRRALGLDEEKMTIVMFEGGYGLGRMGKIAELLVERDLPVNVVAICGKNDELYAKLTALAPRQRTHLIVEGFTDKTLAYLSAADVFLGKSGASSVAEATFFGAALIITKYATSQERDNAEYYLKDVKNALKIFDADEAVEQLELWMSDPSGLRKLQENALKARDKFGCEKAADVMWEMLCKKFPYLEERRIQSEYKV